jgi:predicted transcriptional regulator
MRATENKDRSMSTLSLRLPESIHKRLKEWAQKDDTSINQLITTAVAEKLAALSTLDYLESRAKQASKEKFDAVLARVPNIEAMPEDTWPPTRQGL